MTTMRTHFSVVPCCAHAVYLPIVKTHHWKAILVASAASCTEHSHAVLSSSVSLPIERKKSSMGSHFNVAAFFIVHVLFGFPLVHRRSHFIVALWKPYSNDVLLNHLFQGRTNLPPNKIPWDALRALLSTAIYGGRIDNDFDQVCLHQCFKR